MAAFFTSLAFRAQTATAKAAEVESLPLCGKCMTSDCDKQAKETLKEENGEVYTATADCVHGKLAIADGENFVYAGLWPAESLQSWAKFMKGRTRWRWGPGSDEDTGKIVGFDGPTRAPMVDAISKILCPSGIGGAGKHERRHIGGNP